MKKYCAKEKRFRLLKYDALQSKTSITASVELHIALFSDYDFIAR